MEIEFDPKKSELNAQQRGLPFSVVDEFDFDSALYKVDDRHDYGEIRIRAIGVINGRLHVMVYTESTRGIRVISLRKANLREVKYYEQATAS